jgi:hypothetical protein
VDVDPLADLPVVFDVADIPIDGTVDGIAQTDDGRWVDTEEPDADNSVLAGQPGNALPEIRSLSSAAAAPTRRAQVKVVGPLRRELRYKKPVPMRGRDVRAVVRALSRAGIVTW